MQASKCDPGVIGFTALPRKFHSDSAKHFRVPEEEWLSLQARPRLIPYTA